MAEPTPLAQFGQTIKAKHPEYADIPDEDLANKVLAKYPQYRDMVAPQAAPPEPGMVQKLKDWITSPGQLSQEARANFEQKHGKVEMPGSFEGHPENVGEYIPAGPGQVVQGVKDVARGNFAKGGHELINGAGNTMLPAAALTAVAAPMATLKAVAGGYAGGSLLQSGAEALGANPDQAQLAGDIGGLAGGYGATKLNIRPALSRTLLLGKTPQEAYQSALKPSTRMPEAKINSAIQTGLNEGIPVSAKGLSKLTGLIDDVNTKMDNAIPANSPATVNKFAVASRLNDTAKTFSNQVAPTADLNAISETGNDFIATQPGQIPVKDAAEIKTGTYTQLRKKYGQLGDASVEAQKALARGIKEELITQFPELQTLGQKDQQFINLEGPLEAAVKRIGNHQLLGIGTPIAAGAAKAVTGSNKIAATVAVLKAVLDDPMVKSRLAISLNRAGVRGPAASQRVNSYLGQLAAVSARSADESQ